LTLHLTPQIATARDVCKCIGASLCLTLATDQPPRPVPWSFLSSGNVSAPLPPQESPSTSLGNQAETNGVQVLLVRRFRALVFSEGCGAVGPPTIRKLPPNAGEYAYCVLHWSVRVFLHELDLLVSFSQLTLSRCLQLIGGEVHLPYHDSAWHIPVLIGSTMLRSSGSILVSPMDTTHTRSNDRRSLHLRYPEFPSATSQPEPPHLGTERIIRS
jgi:hypothetical protein